MNTELAMEALASAKANPDRFDMGTWFGGPRGGSRGAEVTEDHMPPCGTTACLAGWVAFHQGPVGSRIAGTIVTVPDAERSVDIEIYARDALDITQDQANVLFYLNNVGEVEAALHYLANHPEAESVDLVEEIYAVRKGAE